MRANSFRADQARAQEDQVGQQHRREDRVEQQRGLVEQMRAGPQAVHQQGAEDDRGGGAARDAERQGRHHGGAGRGVVGGLGAGDATDVALAEPRLVPGPALGLVVADHRRDRAALGRQQADEGADAARAGDGRGAAPEILAARQADRIERRAHHLLVEAAGLGQELGAGEQADHHGDEVDALGQLPEAEGEAVDAGGEVHADGGEQHAERRRQSGS